MDIASLSGHSDVVEMLLAMTQHEPQCIGNKTSTPPGHAVHLADTALHRDITHPRDTALHRAITHPRDTAVSGDMASPEKIPPEEVLSPSPHTSPADQFEVSCYGVV